MPLFARISRNRHGETPAWVSDIDVEVERRLRRRTRRSAILVGTWIIALIVTLYVARHRDGEVRGVVTVLEVAGGTALAMLQIPNRERLWVADEDLAAVSLASLALAALLPIGPDIRRLSLTLFLVLSGFGFLIAFTLLVAARLTASDRRDRDKEAVRRYLKAKAQKYAATDAAEDGGPARAGDLAQDARDPGSPSVVTRTARRRFTFLDRYAICCVWVSFVAGVAFVVLAVVETLRRLDSPSTHSWWNVVAAISAALSFFSISVALLIFKNQAAAAEETEEARKETAKLHDAILDRVGRSVNDLKDRLERAYELSHSVAKDADEQEAEADEPDESDDFIAAERQARPLKIRTAEDEDLKIYMKDEVPLQVLSDLGWGWRIAKEKADPTVAKQDVSLSVSNLLGATRIDGQGNNAWNVTFVTADGQLQMWRLYRGGKKKREPTVRLIPNDQTATVGGAPQPPSAQSEAQQRRS